MRDEKDLRWSEQDEAPTKTWYVVIPFASEGSAERAMRHIIDATGYLASVTNAIEDDPPEYGPDDAEAQRIAEDCADAAAEMHWIDTAGDTP